MLPCGGERTCHVEGGPAPVVVQGVSHQAHRIDSRQGSVWVDDAGMPLVIEGSQFRIERRGARP